MDFNVCLHSGSMGREHCRGSADSGGKIPMREKRGGNRAGRECSAGANRALDVGACGCVG